MTQKVYGDRKCQTPIHHAAGRGAPQRSKHPYIGILGVFLGAGVATLNGRLLSIGLPDLRGALGLGFDEASWLPTVLDMAMMFSGVFCVFLNARLGPRRILLPAAAIFTISSITASVFAKPVGNVLPAGDRRSGVGHFLFTNADLRFDCPAKAAGHLRDCGVCSRYRFHQQHRVRVAGLVHRASLLALDLLERCDLYAVDDGLRLFRRSPPMRPRPRPSWRGFAYFSLGLALLIGALDQGERLDWLNSGVIVAMVAAGLFLLPAAFIRRMRQPNPVVNLAFLKTRNIMILAGSIFVFRFVLLASICYPRIPGKHPTLSTSSDRPSARLGGGAEICRGVAGRADHHPYELTAHSGGGAHGRRGGLLDLRAPRLVVGGNQFRASRTRPCGWSCLLLHRNGGSIVLKRWRRVH